MFVAYANIVVVSKAAIAGDSLKSATSKRVALMYALAGFSLLLIYGFFDRSRREIDVPSVHIATIVPLALQHSSKIDFIDAVSSIGMRGTTRSSILGFSGSCDFLDHGILRRITVNARAIFANSEPAWGLTAIDDSGPGSWRLPSIGIRGAQVIFSQAPSGNTWSLLETCIKLLLLFQGMTAIVNSWFATVFTLIAHNRGRVDLKGKELDLELKRLQIVQLQQQLDRQARERQKEIETTTSCGIVLIT